MPLLSGPQCQEYVLEKPGDIIDEYKKPIAPPIMEHVLKIEHHIYDMRIMQIVPLPIISPSIQQADQDT